MKTYVPPTLTKGPVLSMVTAGANFSGKKGAGGEVEEDVAPPPPPPPVQDPPPV